MNKNKIIISLLITGFILTIVGIVYDGFNYAPSRIKLNYRYVESEKLHPDLDDLQIAFISDVHYNNFMGKKRFDIVIDKLNNTNPDIVIFLGDLIDEENLENFTENIKNQLLLQLESINAKYGKFAILGESDYHNQEVEDTVNQILFDANFEVIKNDMIKISKDSHNTFQLVGIDSPLNNKADIKNAYKDVNESDFTLTVVHTPDTTKVLPQKQTDLVVAGHSHGGQIKIPLLGQIYNQDLANDYYSGLYNVGLIKLYVTNGVGTTNQDVRIFAPAEIVVNEEIVYSV